MNTTRGYLYIHSTGRRIIRSSNNRKIPITTQRYEQDIKSCFHSDDDRAMAFQIRSSERCDVTVS